MRKKRYCSCCKEEIKFSGKWEEYAYKVDEDYQCGWQCYSTEFDKKYKESKTNIYGAVTVGNTKGKFVDRGYERHGSR